MSADSFEQRNNDSRPRLSRATRRTLEYPGENDYFHRPNGVQRAIRTIIKVYFSEVAITWGHCRHLDEQY